MCPAAIALTGTEEQKRRYLIPVAKGERVLAWSMTEPAGSASTGQHQSRITPDGAGFRANGLKLFCTQGLADTIIFLARTSRGGSGRLWQCVAGPELARHRGGSL